MQGARISAGSRFIRAGVTIIELRTIIAYGLIALLVISAASFIAYARHNTHAKRYARQKIRDRERDAERLR
jgi:hypothetical protein